jgi:hypothetical protein
LDNRYLKQSRKQTKIHALLLFFSRRMSIVSLCVLRERRSISASLAPNFQEVVFVSCRLVVEIRLKSIFSMFRGVEIGKSFLDISEEEEVI